MAAMRLITTGFLSLPLACRQGGNRNKGWQTFPIAFSHVLGVQATRNTGTWEHSVIVSSVSNTGFYSEARNQSNDNPSDYWWYWFAFGY